jgi:hypothetical protein
MAHNYEHNFYVFYFLRIKNGREKMRKLDYREKKRIYSKLKRGTVSINHLLYRYIFSLISRTSENVGELVNLMKH